MSTKARKNQLLFATLFVVGLFVLLTGFAIVDYQLFNGSGFNAIVVTPAERFLNFLRAQILESGVQGEANIMLIGTAIGLYVFLAFLFYLFLVNLAHKRDVFDENYHNNAPKDKLVWFVTSVLFKNIIISLGLFTFYVILLAAFVQFIFN